MKKPRRSAIDMFPRAPLDEAEREACELFNCANCEGMCDDAEPERDCHRRKNHPGDHVEAKSSDGSQEKVMVTARWPRRNHIAFPVLTLGFERMLDRYDLAVRRVQTLLVRHASTFSHSDTTILLEMLRDPAADLVASVRDARTEFMKRTWARQRIESVLKMREEPSVVAAEIWRQRFQPQDLDDKRAS